MNSVVYNIPLRRLEWYQGRKVIVRTRDPAELVSVLPDKNLEDVVGVQLLSLAADPDALANWGYAIPVELVVLDPLTEFPLLYRHAKLLDKHPVRASIPAVPRFSTAVKVATALQFRVKLEVGQPDAATIEEMHAVLDFYLHASSVSQAIEFFHTTLSSFHERRPLTLWDIQEDDPACVRYVTDDGSETVVRQPLGGNVTGKLSSFVANLQTTQLAEHGECSRCEFFEHCGSYFKWPRKDYTCDGVKTVFRSLKDAAAELESDLKTFVQARKAAAQ
jgi:hypothetical protein